MNADQPTPDLADGHSTAWGNFVAGIEVELLELERCVSSAVSVAAAAALVAGERPNAPQQRVLLERLQRQARAREQIKYSLRDVENGGRARSYLQQKLWDRRTADMLEQVAAIGWLAA